MKCGTVERGLGRLLYVPGVREKHPPTAYPKSCMTVAAWSRCRYLAIASLASLSAGEHSALTGAGGDIATVSLLSERLHRHATGHPGFPVESEYPIGVFIDGSSISAVNGVYGPKLAPNEHPPFAAEAHALYRNDESSWLLAHVPDDAGNLEWILVDETTRDRFGHTTAEQEPGSGLQWRHLNRSPRVTLLADSSATINGDSMEGSSKEASNEVLEVGADDEDELPWLVHIIPGKGLEYFEQIRVMNRRHTMAKEEAASRRKFPDTEGSSKESHPPEDLDVDVIATEAKRSLDGSMPGSEEGSEEAERPTHEGGWVAAVWHVERASILRRDGRLLDALREVQSSLSLFPRYARALEELGKSMLDAERPLDAFHAFECLLAVEPERDSLMAWLVRAAAQERRLQPEVKPGVERRAD